MNNLHVLTFIKGSPQWQHLRNKPDQPSPSVEVAGEELATQKEVKLADLGVDAVAAEVKHHICLRSCGCELRP
jgi:hypothetical protein